MVPQLRDSVNVWRDFVPVVQYLRNPDMKDRHWARINEQTQLFIERGEKLTLGLLLGMQVGGKGHGGERIEAWTKMCTWGAVGEPHSPTGTNTHLTQAHCGHHQRGGHPGSDYGGKAVTIPHPPLLHPATPLLQIVTHKDTVGTISGEATQEAGLEVMLERVVDKWRGAEFSVNPYKDIKDGFILGEVGAPGGRRGRYSGGDGVNKWQGTGLTLPETLLQLLPPLRRWTRCWSSWRTRWP